jgi:hypothetical protein
LGGGVLEEDIMAKANDFVSPANLWGKPLPGATSKAPTEKKEEKVTRMRTNYEDEDVDAELEEDVIDDEAAYAEEETEYEDDSNEDIHETAAKLSEEEVTTAGDDDDEDETEYAPEEGDEVSDEIVYSAAESDEDDAPVATPSRVIKTKTKKVKDMAEKKSGADHIREEIARRQESGDSLRGVDIVAALAKKRVTVSPAQVSQLLKKTGAASGKRAAPAGEEKSRVAARNKRQDELPRKAPKLPVAKAPSGTSTLPMAQLTAASEFLAACDGCYDTANTILSQHQRLHDIMKS